MRMAIGNKPGIDATKKLSGESHERGWPPLIKMDESVKAKVENSYKSQDMSKSVATVGFDILGFSDKYIPFSSDQTLLNYDIIAFSPDISGMFGYSVEQ